ncbi:NADPH-dependent FMN reductase [Nocardia sp. 004]|uniref:NADPH-dependent FMN reductase n=1 Tax=Nocardia sp. 004 TaxID=3385978 RepID=UPI0039A01AD7
MSDKPIRLIVICASVREGRFGPTVARWFAEYAAHNDQLEVDYLDLADYPLPARITEHPDARDAEVLGEVSARLLRADAFALVTPEYNHSFPASLKHLIDWCPEEWRAKPVGLVSYGGLAGGLRAVEQLRQVLGEVHAVALRDTVSFHNAWDRFDATGQPTDEAGANAAADTMVEHILWWGRALRTARDETPMH